MAHEKIEHKRCRKPGTQQKLASFAVPKPKSTATMTNVNHATESREKKKFVFVKGMGCKGISVPASTSAVIRSASDWEAKKIQKRKQTLRNGRNPANVVDVPDVCCTPPGIGIASDFAPGTRNTTAPRFDHRKHSREDRRHEDDPAPKFPGFRANHRSAGEIIEMLMFQQALLSERILHGHDRYRRWRLNVDDMSYEELLDLSDKIGYVCTGLREEEISACLRKFKHCDSDSTSLPMHGHQKDWKCCICQEKCRRGDEMGMLDCGHYHHVNCIKQWLLQKNECPVCKSAAMRGTRLK